MGGKRTDKALRAIRLLSIMNDTSIALEVGLSKERIRQLRQEEGTGNKLKNMHMCTLYSAEEFVSKLFSLDPSKLTSKEAGAILGINQNVFNDLRQRHGIPKFKDPKLKYTKELVTNLYNKHNGHIRNMAQELGIFQSSMSRYCRRYGLKGKGNTKEWKIKNA